MIVKERSSLQNWQSWQHFKELIDTVDIKLSQQDKRPKMLKLWIPFYVVTTQTNKRS